MEFFLLVSRGCCCCPRKRRKTRFLGLKKKGLIQCIAGKKGLAGACWTCWGVGLAGCLLFCFPLLLPFASSFYFIKTPTWACFLFLFFCFCFALVLFLFVSFQHYLPFSSCSFYAQIFICTLKHNIKFRLNKINITHIK